jgi:hypothetical protein
MAIVRLKGLSKLGGGGPNDLEAATFRLVAQCFKQLCYHMPPHLSLQF